MSKKSFIEEELANEAKARTKSQKQSLSQRFARLLHKDKPDISPKPKTPLTSSVYTRLPEDCGLLLTPNEIREVCGYPTISDEPQSVMQLHLENTSLSAKVDAIQSYLTTKDLYTKALLDMRAYGRSNKND